MTSRRPSRRSTGRRVVGLTGGIGVGKSTVAAELSRLGATIVDCDGLGRVVVEPGGLAYEPLVARFGPGILEADGRVDRPELASRVFGDPEALADLNAVTHPAIDIEIARAIAAADTPTVVLDMAVLVESDLGKGQYDEVLVVEAPLAVRLERLARDRGMDEDQARARIASQVDDAQRREVADHVLVNDGSLGELRDAVRRYWDEAGLH
jgi:dephospho-CoA kinase